MGDHKHVVSVKPQIDFFTNSCKGKAEVTVRLGAGETENSVYTKLVKSGLCYRKKKKVGSRCTKYEKSS